MTRRTFFHRTVGALATVAIAPRVTLGARAFQYPGEVFWNGLYWRVERDVRLAFRSPLARPDPLDWLQLGDGYTIMGLQPTPWGLFIATGRFMYQLTGQCCDDFRVTAVGLVNDVWCARCGSEQFPDHISRDGFAWHGADGSVTVYAITTADGRLIQNPWPGGPPHRLTA